MKLQITIDRADLNYKEIETAKRCLDSMEFGFAERVTPKEKDLVIKYKELLRLGAILKELNEMGFCIQQK